MLRLSGISKQEAACHRVYRVAARARPLSVVFSPTPQLPALHCNSCCETVPIFFPVASPCVVHIAQSSSRGASSPWPLSGPSFHLLLLCALPGLNLDVGAQLPCAIGFDSSLHSSGNDSAFPSAVLGQRLPGVDVYQLTPHLLPHGPRGSANPTGSV